MTDKTQSRRILAGFAAAKASFTGGVFDARCDRPVPAELTHMDGLQ